MAAKCTRIELEANGEMAHANSRRAHEKWNENENENMHIKERGERRWSSEQAYANMLLELAHVAPDVLLERGARALHDLVALQQRGAVRAQQKRHRRHALPQLVLIQAFGTIRAEN